MFADKVGQVRVRSNFAGAVELLVRVGEQVERGQGLVVVEGDRELERLSARQRSRVVEVCVADGAEVEAAALLLVLLELPEP